MAYSAPLLVRKAFSATWKLVYGRIRSSVVAATVAVISLLVWWFWKGFEQMSGIALPLIITLLTTASIFFVLFLVNLFYLTPRRLYTELEKKLGDRGRGLEIAQQALKRLRTDKSKRLLKEKSADEFADLIHKAKKLVERLHSVNEDDYPTEDEIENWLTAVYVAISMVVPWSLHSRYITEFNCSDEVAVALPNNLSPKAEKDYRWLMSRISTLRGILRELTGS